MKVFHSRQATAHKREMCAIGQRLWQRGYVNGNDGNISVRLTGQLVLCTPTLVSKGFMRPAEMCLVDLTGQQVAGPKPRTSEILMHLAMMRAQPRARAVVHCHAPYGTAFAAMGIAPPREILPEKEVLIGEIAIAPYHRTATPALGEAVARLVDKHNVILLANHGVVSWSETLEDAYFKIEILEGFLHTMLIAKQWGRKPRRLTAAQIQELLELKRGYGIPDPRLTN